MLILILFAAFAYFLAYLDVFSSKRNNQFPQIYEQNKRYRLPDGRCDVGKLTRDKAIFLGALTAAAVVLFIFGVSGILSGLAFLVSGLVTLPTILKNFKLYRKYK